MNHLHLRPTMAVKTMLTKLLSAYSQEQLARLLEVSSRSVYNYTQGVQPRRQTIMKMKDLLAELELNHTDEPPPIVPKTQPPEESISLEKLDSIETSLLIIESYIKVISNSILKLRSVVEEVDLKDLQVETNKLLAESLQQIRAASKLLSKGK